MFRDLTLHQAIQDPLIAQMRKADGIGMEEFATFLMKAADHYRVTELESLQRRRVDQFYRLIGAGDIHMPPPRDVPRHVVKGPIWDLC
ncbi:hypothetical protein ACQKKX_03620 [Neorhizobium sp. NPDC001467]|uniref:hypothetical protein n=1 Tax=Neorhizobium sp. NPDC001467 TaxID=3390595 RepID=UPI003D091223